MTAARDRYPVLVLDIERCTGCSACRLACAIANELPSGVAWRRVHTFNPGRDPRTAVYHLSLACNHCRNPLCRRACPAAALVLDPATGTVQLDADRCIGCGMCSWVCPYGAPALDPVARVMTKCTLCRPRLGAGLDPACVVACPLGALRLEHRDQPVADEPELAGLPAVGARPSLRILHRRRGLRPPPMAPAPDGPLELPGELPDEPPVASGPGLAQGLRHEWSLLVFTILVSWIVAWLVALVVQARAPSGVPSATAAGFVLLGAGLLAAAVSSLHLARPWRAVLAVRNLAHSWISREVVLFGASVVLGSAFLCLGLPALVGWIAVAAGIGCTISIDMVYRCRGQLVTLHPHSAMVSLTTPLLAAALLELPGVVIATLGVKLVLYLARKLALGRSRAVAGPVTSCVRLALMAVAGLACLAPGSCASPLVLLSLLVGEALDRAELYAELRFLDPPLQLARDLRRVLGT